MCACTKLTAIAPSPTAEANRFIEPLRTQPTTARHAYHLYVVRLKARPGETTQQTAVRRKALYLALREQKIVTQVHYIPVPWQPYYQSAKGPQADFPGAERYYASCLSLPMYPRMTDADVRRVLEALRRYFVIGEGKLL